MKLSFELDIEWLWTSVTLFEIWRVNSYGYQYAGSHFTYFTLIHVYKIVVLHSPLWKLSIYDFAEYVRYELETSEKTATYLPHMS
jgi:hypothetical protein